MVDPQAARHQIDIRLAKLRVMTFAELSALPAATSESIPFGSEEWTATTYVEVEAKKGIRVVVQVGPAEQPKFLLLRVQADGFRIEADERVTPLSKEDLYEFM